MADTWKVTSQRQTQSMIDGQFVPAMEVTFKTVSGVVGTVVVPVGQYSPDMVRQAIEHRVAQIDAVSSL